MAELVDVTHIRTWDDARPLVMPTLRSVAFISRMAADLEAHADSLPSVDVGDCLFSTLVLDLPTQNAHITASMLAQWEVSFDVAFETALGRLEQMSHEPFNQLGDVVWAAPWRDGYTAARVLLPELLRRPCPSPFIAVPDRDNLLVAMGPAGFEQLVLMIASCEADDVITRAVLQLVDDTLVEVEPPDTPIGQLYEQLLSLPY